MNCCITRISIPWKFLKNTIFIEGTSQNGYKKFSWSVNGGGYKYFGYNSRVSPSTRNPISWMSQVTIPVSCDDTQYLGRTVKPKISLYKNSEDPENLVGEPITAAVGSDAKSLIIDSYNYNLEADATYLVVMDADQFKLWDYSTQREIKDTSNENLVLASATSPKASTSWPSTAPP